MTLDLTFDEGGRRRDIVTDIQARIPWLPRNLIRMYIDFTAELGGDQKQAWEMVQQSDQYLEYFIGIRDENGILKMNERQWHQAMTTYRKTVRQVGINPNVFTKADYGSQIAGDVGIQEFAQKVSAVTERVMNQLPRISEEYARLWGLKNASREAIVASVFKPALGVELLEKRITMAEIAGEARDSGYWLKRSTIRALYEAGVGREEADRAYAQAEGLLPVLGTLLRRHEDADDEFDIEEFTNAMLLDDPIERTKMMRLIQQERSSFSEAGAYGVTRSQQTGGMTGLQTR